MVAMGQGKGRKLAQDMGWTLCSFPAASPAGSHGWGRCYGLTLITEGPLPRSPLETLNDAVLYRAKKSLVHLQRNMKAP